MRYALAYEGEPTVDGRVIQPGGLTWPDEPIPLRHPSSIDDGGVPWLGTATDLRREPDGRLTAELSVDLPVGTAPQLELDEVEWDASHAGLVVISGRVRSVVIGNDPAWPALRVQASESGD